MKPVGKEHLEMKCQPDNQVEVIEVMYSLLSQVEEIMIRVKQL